MDVVSLYTNIPHTLGLQALTHFLDQRTDPNPPTKTLVRLTELVLTLNTFTFDKNTFHQTKGVAMGTKMGPSYACLFMGYMEHLFFTQYTKPTPVFYRRYIDDIFGFTSFDRKQLTNFIQDIQNFHTDIEYTFQVSETSITFLDINITLSQKAIQTSVHYKPTDSHAYLSYQSSHNPQTKDSIPFSQFLRLRRICSNDTDFLAKSKDLTTYLLRRHYPNSVVQKALQQVQTLSRPHCLEDKTESPNPSRPVAILTYHPVSNKIRSTLLSNWPLLLTSTEAATIFTEKPLFAYKRDTNLQDMLVRSSLSRPTRHPPGTRPCNDSRCKTCPFLSSSTHIQGPKGSINISKYFNCKSSNLIYLLYCSRCSIQYVGETGLTLNTRFTEHLADIRHNRDKPIARHFNSSNHSIQDVRVLAIWKMFVTNTNTRKDMESHLISKLGTKTPLGLNEM